MHRYQQILNVRRIDCRPSRYLTRRIGVCVVGVSTSCAEKLRLAFSASLIDRAATGASARRIAWIDKFNRDPGSFRLVQNEAFQLVKRPAVQTAALLFTSPYPNAETLEILKSNPALGAFSNVYYLFGNYVICVSRESLLFASTTAQQAFSSFGAFLLQLAAQANIARPLTGHCSARESLTVAGVGDRRQTEINADPINGFDFFRIGNVDGSEQKPFLVPVDQVGLASLEFKQFPVVITTNERDLFSAIERPDTGEAFSHVPGQDPPVITDRAVLAKCAANIPIKFISVGNLGIQADDDLRRQRELVSDGPIETPVQRKLSELFRLPSKFTQAIASLICTLKSTQQSVRLLGRWLQFYLSGEIHYQT